MKFLSFALVAPLVARADVFDDDNELGALRMLGSHNASNVTVTTPTPTVTEAPKVTAAPSNSTSNATETRDGKTKITQATDLALSFTSVPTVAAEQVVFKSASGKAVGGSYCTQMSGSGKVFDDATQCHAAEGSTTATIAWSATVAYTGGPAGFAAASAAITMGTRRLTATAASAAYVMTVEAFVDPSQVSSANTRLTTTSGAVSATTIEAAVKTGVESAMTAAGYNFTVTVSATVTANAPVQPAAATSSAAGLTAGLASLFALVASIAMF